MPQIGDISVIICRDISFFIGFCLFSDCGRRLLWVLDNMVNMLFFFSIQSYWVR